MNFRTRVVVLAALAWVIVGRGESTAAPPSASGEQPEPQAPKNRRALKQEEALTAEEKAALAQAEAELKELDDKLTPQERAEISRLVGQAWAEEAQRFSAERVESNAAKAANEKERRLALAEFRDPRFPRDDAIRSLKTFLSDPSLNVRVYAAELMFKLGSKDAREMLLATLRSAPTLSLAELEDVVQAAQLLHRYGDDVPADLLIPVIKLRGARGLIGIMSAQHDPAFEPYLLAAARENPVGMMTHLGEAGIQEGYAIAKEKFENSTSPRIRVMAAWTMFQLKGDRDAFDHVFAVARGERGTGNGQADSDANMEARRRLYGVKDTAVRDFLRKQARETDALTNTCAIASLFYVQKDYAFVDAYLAEYLENPRNHVQKDGALMARLAVARNQPGLNELLAEQSSEFKKFFLAPARGVPPESWIHLYLSDLPRAPK